MSGPPDEAGLLAKIETRALLIVPEEVLTQALEAMRAATYAQPIAPLGIRQDLARATGRLAAYAVALRREA